MEWFKHLVTGKDNQTHDIARHSWVWTTLTIMAGGAWNAFHTGTLDLLQFAQALAFNTGAHGAAIFAKAKTEPDPEPTKE